MSRRARLSLCALFAACAAVPSLRAEDEQPSQEYVDQLAQLQGMLTSRDTEEYEVAFQAIALERVLIRDRASHEELYHALVFRLRNEIAEGSQELADRSTRYSEVLKQMADQYEYAKVEGGVTLDVHGEKVLDRPDKRAKTRKLNIMVYASDENGSAITLLDGADGGAGRKALNIPDPGAAEAATPLDRVRDRAEEQLGRRLLTLDEIRAKELPPYDPTAKDDDAVASVGEVYGVAVFHCLGNEGDRFTIEVRGLSNKLRIHHGEVVPDQVEKYTDMRVLRRAVVLVYDRPGDEYYRDLDRFTLIESGWRWLDTFQRLQQRSDSAYTNYFLDNLIDDKAGLRPDLEAKFWPYYRQVREAHPDAGEDKLPDLERGLTDR